VSLQVRAALSSYAPDLSGRGTPLENCHVAPRVVWIHDQPVIAFNATLPPAISRPLPPEALARPGRASKADLFSTSIKAGGQLDRVVAKTGTALVGVLLGSASGTFGPLQNRCDGPPARVGPWLCLLFAHATRQAL